MEKELRHVRALRQRKEDLFCWQNRVSSSCSFEVTAAAASVATALHGVVV